MPPTAAAEWLSNARQAALVVHHPAASVVRLTGDEVRRWTNGMFTNNTRRLTLGQGNRHAWCNDRGRVNGVLDLYLVAEDQVVLVLEGVDSASFAKQFQMYLILDDIELDDLTDVDEDGAVALVSVCGPQTGAVLAAAGLSLPEADHQHVVVDGVRVCHRDRTGLGGADLLVPVGDLDAWMQRLTDGGARPGTPDMLDALRILDGRAAWPVDGTDKSLVHELRFNEDCCAFDKGCYVGQEVINRVDVRGGVQKRLTMLTLDAAPSSGAAVQVDGKAVGTVTSITTADGTVRALGVLRKAAWEPGTVVDVDGAGPATVVAHPRG